MNNVKKLIWHYNARPRSMLIFSKGINCKYNHSSNAIYSQRIPFYYGNKLIKRDLSKMVRVLNVAEKNDAAKNLAEILSRGGFTRREGHSKFNKIYEFDTVLHGERCHMVMTSVSGHLLTHSFTGNYKKWYGCSPLELFDTSVIKVCIEDMKPIKRTLEAEARTADRLIIWTDCDREGENIGFEIITVCRAIKPNLQVLRAKFSEITLQSANRALQNLEAPDQKQNDAVEVRSELDLRIGAAFTRFQTLRLQKVFPQALANILISYGSCQFPTLGFVVERFKAIQNFIPEGFWKIKVSHEYENCVVDFLWKRVRLFNELPCQVLLDKCLENPVATVKSVTSRPKSKWRPQPLDTIELEKLASRKLRINAKETMKIAENLYTKGLISYPRTETNIFPKEIDLVPLIGMQTQDVNWGEFANRVLNDGPTPRQGKKSDQAHPPIHPTKYDGNLVGNDKIVYEFIVRHFLACCSKDAKGTETVVEIVISQEEFAASGLIILERNYLDVYPYDRWSDKEMPNYQQGQNFDPTVIEMIAGQTSPPPLLTEADLIALMEKHGIGTDATHADHIETIKNRQYVGLQDSKFVPGKLGMGLVEGYDAMGFHMSKPNLRAGLEADLKRICEGIKDPKVVLRDQISNYKQVFEEAMRQAQKIDGALAQFFDEAPQQAPQNIVDLSVVQCVLKCPNCNNSIIVKKKFNANSFYLSCRGYPECKISLWFPDSVINVQVTEERCLQCTGAPMKLKFTFSPRSYVPHFPDEHIACVGGCDREFLDILGIEAFPNAIHRAQDAQVPLGRPSNSSRDSGYSSSLNSSHSTQSTIVLNNINTTTVAAAPKNIQNRTTSITRVNGSIGLIATTSRNNTYSNQPNTDSFSRTNSEIPSASRQQFPISQSTNSLSRNQDSDHDNAILCGCNQNATKLTVRKEGPNTGRQFYKCCKPQGQGCNFFLWADEPTSKDTNDSVSDSFGRTNSQVMGGGSRSFNGRSDTGGSSNAASQSRTFNNKNWDSDGHSDDPDDIVVNCTCGVEAKKLTVQKEGPNKGRLFYACWKMRDEQCGFFKWADELDGGSEPSAASNGWRGPSNPGRGRGRGRGGGAAKQSGDSGPQKRKCGMCGESGHNRRNCPNN